MHANNRLYNVLYNSMQQVKSFHKSYANNPFRISYREDLLIKRPELIWTLVTLSRKGIDQTF